MFDSEDHGFLRDSHTGERFVFMPVACISDPETLALYIKKLQELDETEN